MKKLIRIIFFGIHTIFIVSAMEQEQKHCNDAFTHTLLQEISAEKYDDLSDPIFQVHKKLIKENIPNLYKFTRLLHLNCNDGKLSAYFAAELNKRIVVGMDYREQLIEQAQNRYPELSKNLRFQKTNFDDPAFNQYFQLIFSTNGLQAMPCCQKNLRCAYDALLPGGMLFIATPSKDNEGLIMQTVSQVLGAAHWQPYQETLSTILESPLTQETLIKKLKKANFININLETQQAAIEEQSLTRYIRRIISRLTLSEELQTQLTQEIVKTYFKTTLKMKDRNLTDQIPVYIVKAYKECIA